MLGRVGAQQIVKPFGIFIAVFCDDVRKINLLQRHGCIIDQRLQCFPEIFHRRVESFRPVYQILFRCIVQSQRVSICQKHNILYLAFDDHLYNMLVHAPGMLAVVETVNARQPYNIETRQIALESLEFAFGKYQRFNWLSVHVLINNSLVKERELARLWRLSVLHVFLRFFVPPSVELLRPPTFVFVSVAVRKAEKVKVVYSDVVVCIFLEHLLCLLHRYLIGNRVVMKLLYFIVAFTNSQGSKPLFAITYFSHLFRC